MIKITEFKLEHLANLDDFDRIVEAYEDNPEMLNWYTNGPAYTIYDQDGIVIVGGLCFQGGGLAVAWSIPTKRIKKYPIYCTKVARWVIKAGLEELKLRKIFAIVAVDDPSAIRWAKVIGLEREAFLKQHNWDGKDVYVYSAFRE